jgi:hypothetical protein
MRLPPWPCWNEFPFADKASRGIALSELITPVGPRRLSRNSYAVRNPTSELIIERNTFINDYDGPTTFVRNGTAVPARLIGNNFTGKVTALSGRGTVEP